MLNCSQSVHEHLFCVTPQWFLAVKLQECKRGQSCVAAGIQKHCSKAAAEGGLLCHVDAVAAVTRCRLTEPDLIHYILCYICVTLPLTVFHNLHLGLQVREIIYFIEHFIFIFYNCLDFVSVIKGLSSYCVHL